mgnify:CR=1 FL=1
MNQKNKKLISLPSKLILFDNYNKKEMSFIINDNNFLLQNNIEKEYLNSNFSEYNFIYLPFNNQKLIKDKEKLTDNINLNLTKQYPNKLLTELSFEEYIDFVGSDKEKKLLLHMINETKRIEKAKQAIIIKDYKLLAKEINQSNYSLKTLVFDLTQHQEQIIIFAHGANALATKLVDSGFIFLLESSKTKTFIDNFKKLYNNYYYKDINLLNIALNQQEKYND